MSVSHQDKFQTLISPHVSCHCPRASEPPCDKRIEAIEHGRLLLELELAGDRLVTRTTESSSSPASCPEATNGIARNDSIRIVCVRLSIVFSAV
jgi:hypothetical protein